MLPPLPRCSGWAYSSLIHPAVSTFPERVVGSACTSSFSRLARRSLALRPAHSRCHQFVTRFPKASATSSPPQLLRLLPAGAFAGWDLHPLESAALSRRTPLADINRRFAAMPRRQRAHFLLVTTALQRGSRLGPRLCWTRRPSRTIMNSKS